MPSPPGNLLMNGTAQKMAADVVRIPCDFGNEPVLVENAQVINGVLVLPYAITSFAVTESTGKLTITKVQLDSLYQLSALIAGGASGATYYLNYSITLNDPDTTVISRSGALAVY